MTEQPKGLKQRLDYNKDFRLDWHDADEAHDGYQLKWVGKNYAMLAAAQQPMSLIYQDNNLTKLGGGAASENIFLTGDNLESLRQLQNAYRNQIKLIYIDPPYNTGSDGFVYKDNFTYSETELAEKFDFSDAEIKRLKTLDGRSSHSAWLTFMYPRLRLAKNLLRDDGVIFISIDDNEQANLKLLCDEIFGEVNFLYNLSVVNSLNGNDNSSGMMETQESCLIYAKNRNSFSMGVLPVEDDEASDWEIDELGYWKVGASLKAAGINASRADRPNLFFPIWVNKANLTISITEKSGEDWYRLLPLTNGEEMRWYWKKEKFEKDANEVVVKRIKDSFSLYKKQRPALGDMPSKRGKTTFYSPKYSSANSSLEVKELFGGRRIFDYPKAVALIRDFLSLGNVGGNDLILDFFAGSGTTAQAVMELNKQDGGNRRWILCQLDEPTKEDSEARKAGYATIDQIARERIKRAAAKIGDDSGFQHFYVKKPSEKTFADIEEFDPAAAPETLFQADLIAPFSAEANNVPGGASGEQVLLASWTLADGYELSEKPRPLDIAGYQAHYYPGEKLYCIASGWGAAQTEALVNRLGLARERGRLSVEKIIIYQPSFTMEALRELKLALANVDKITLEERF